MGVVSDVLTEMLEFRGVEGRAFESVFKGRRRGMYKFRGSLGGVAM